MCVITAAVRSDRGSPLVKDHSAISRNLVTCCATQE
jgi:hypothetical protein